MRSLDEPEKRCTQLALEKSVPGGLRRHACAEWRACWNWGGGNRCLLRLARKARPVVCPQVASLTAFSHGAVELAVLGGHTLALHCPPLPSTELFPLPCAQPRPRPRPVVLDTGRQLGLITFPDGGSWRAGGVTARAKPSSESFPASLTPCMSRDCEGTGCRHSSPTWLCLYTRKTWLSFGFLIPGWNWKLFRSICNMKQRGVLCTLRRGAVSVSAVL